MSEDTARRLVPSATELLEVVGSEVGISRQQVERALAEFNLVLKTPATSDRRLRLLRVAATGVKNDGTPFTVQQSLGTGVWGIVHPANSAGKTSMLEMLVLPLRGAERDLPKDVRSWMHRVRLDVVVAGRPIRIAIDASAGWERSVRACILSAETEANLLAATDDQLRRLAEAVGLGEVERSIGEFMLDALRMERTQVWQSSGGADGEGAPQMHGWKSYFGACYLNPGGDELLLGDVSASGLPGRLLELFVDLPYSTALTELTVASRRVRKGQAQEIRRAAADADARSSHRASWQQELDDVEKKITALRSDSTVDVSALLTRVDDTAEVLRVDRDDLERTAQALRDASGDRLCVEQAKLDVAETQQARRVLGRLDPTCCPRCEEPVTAERRTDERDSAACAVCTRPLPEIEPETAKAALQQLDDDLAAARRAEQEIATEHDAVQRRVERSQTAHVAARAALQQTLTAEHPLSQLREAEVAAAELRGRLAATSPTPSTGPAETADAAEVLGAVEKHVRRTVEQAAKQLLPEMDTEIIAMCQRFGVQNLDSVKLDRAGHVNAVKAGQKMPFKDLSRGDRLRMRIATVIALLRVGASRGVTSHPGLLLIDSIAAEELTPDAARSLIAELDAAAREQGDLQVVFTTANPELVTGLLPPNQIITSEADHLF
jgi:hypothetical protein